MNDTNNNLDLIEPEVLELEMTTPSEDIIIIPPDVIRTFSKLPEKAKIGTVAAFVSEDKKELSGFYVVTEIKDEKAVWNLFVTSQSGIVEIKIPDRYIKEEMIAEGAITSPTIAEYAIENKHLDLGCVDEYVLADQSVRENHIKDNAIMEKHIFKNQITTEKIQDKAITKEKISFDVASEEFVENSIKNIISNKPFIEGTIFELDDFENYETHQVIKTTEPIPKNWSDVKIFAAFDEIKANSTNPMEFDFSQISETNYAKTGPLPEQIDFSSIAGRGVMCAMIFLDEESKKFMLVQLLQTTGSDAQLGVILYSGTENTQYNAFYTAEHGWTNESIGKLTEKDRAIFESTYPALKIVDFASFHKDNPDVAPEGVECIPQILLDLFLKSWMHIYYPPGYYLTDKASSIVPKTWSEIQKIVRNGQASLVFSIGDQLICSKNGVVHVWDIIGFDYDIPFDSNYKHSITLQLNTAFEYQAFDTNSNDYSTSDIRTYLNEEYLNGFDEDFLAVVGSTRKLDLMYNTDEGTGEAIYPGSDIFFLLSAEEVSSNPYDYYSSADVDQQIRIKNAGSTLLCHWWLRSNTTSNGNVAVADKVGTDGEISAGNITRSSYYIAPACVIY